MAKKRAAKKAGKSVTKIATPRRSTRSKSSALETAEKIESLADMIFNSARRKISPRFEIPTRALI